MSKFRILHLSDAHIGNKRWDIDRFTVFEGLFKDLRKEAEAGGRPDLVVFSGDLIFGLEKDKPRPLAEQLDLAATWLKDIEVALGFPVGSLPLFIVPGNHDINRDTVTEGDNLLVDSLNWLKVDDLLSKQNNTWKQLVKRQDEWKTFVDSIRESSGFIFDSGILSSMKIIDLADDNRIGIAGLNTSWASSRRGEQGKLWIGSRQFDAVLHKIHDTNFKILVTHHPISFLHPEEKTKLEPKVETKYNLYLHGHEHLQWINDSAGHLRVAAGACYQGSEKEASYSWITIDFAQKEVHLKLREWKNQGAGAWASMFLPGRTNETGERVTKLPFQDFVIPERSDRTALQSGISSRDDRSIPTMLSGGGSDFCRVLRDNFDAHWDPPSGQTGDAVNLVYWPVKLRNPNVVHAAQAFMAAGFQSRGAEIFLWIDDVGGPVNSSVTEKFRNQVRRWIDRVGVDGEIVQIQTMNELLDSEPGRKIWETLKRWFTDSQNHKLLEVFRIAKLLPPSPAPSEQSIHKLLDSAPKKLLSPPIVWTCLVDTLSRRSVGGVITLGGIDEQPLWNAWRLRITDAKREVAHLYAATLKSGSVPFDMDEASVWIGTHHIESALQTDKERCEIQQTDFLRDGGMPHWCFSHCVALPELLKGLISDPHEEWRRFMAVGEAEVIRRLPRMMEKWLF